MRTRLKSWISTICEHKRQTSSCSLRKPSGFECGMTKANFIIAYPAADRYRFFSATLLSFRLACPRFVSRTHSQNEKKKKKGAGTYTELVTKRHHSLTNANPSATKCLFHTNIISFRCAIFTAVIQRPIKAELSNFTQVWESVIAWAQFTQPHAFLS